MARAPQTSATRPALRPRSSEPPSLSGPPAGMYQTSTRSVGWDRHLACTAPIATPRRKFALTRRSYPILKALGPPRSTLPTPLRSSPPITDAPEPCGQLRQRSRHPRPARRPTKDRAAAVGHRSDPATIKSPVATTCGRGPTYGRASTEHPKPSSGQPRRIIHDRRASPHGNTQPRPQARTNSTPLTPRPELKYEPRGDRIGHVPTVSEYLRIRPGEG
jgi:hypothetical protein